MKIEDAIKQTTPFSSQQQKLVVNLFYTHVWLEGKMREFLKAFDITKQQFNILRILRGAKKPLSTSVIRARMVDKMSDTTRLIDRMIIKGWVSKIECPKDRRLVDIEITTAGKNLLTKVDKDISKMDEIVSKLTLEEIGRLNRLLDKLRD